jgi:hypothetical protein
MEPKSIHTYLDTKQPEIYNYDIDVRITDFPHDADPGWLYYFSLHVKFTHHDEWSHGGFQWSGTKEFASNGNKGVNWGGGALWDRSGGVGVNNTPFTWELGMWYRYRVWRVEKDDHGFNRWLFAVMDYTNGQELQFGTIKTKSSEISGAVVFTETGYGVQCDSPSVRVEWRNPCFRTPHGEFKADVGIANYNGTCSDPCNTDQGILSDSPRAWFRLTNTPRHVQAETALWRA